MNDLVDRQAAIDAMCKSGCGGYCGIPCDDVKAIEQLPSAQPERKTGKWTLGCDMPPMKHRNGKPKKFWPSLRYCSVCGHEAFDDSDWGEQLFEWCPYCGADMRGEGHE